jgi:ribonuclease P protein component
VQTLPKTERLCSQKQIAALMNEQRVLFHFPFKVFFSLTPAIAGQPCCRMAVNVPKRNFKKAVTRNLLKRRTREAFRKNKTTLYDTLQQKNKTFTLFFHYVSTDILTYDVIEPSLQEIFAKLAKANDNAIDVAAAGVD